MPRATLLTAGLTAAICAAVLAPLPASAAPSRPATCDEISGFTLLQSSRWRIVRTPTTLDGPAPLWACRRTSVPPRRLLRLESGAFYLDGCWCSTPIGIVGDRLLRNQHGTSQHTGYSTISLVDLRTGLGKALDGGVVGSEASPPYGLPWASITPAGGVIIGFDDQNGDRYGVPGSLKVIGAGGVARSPLDMVAHAPSIGSASEPPGMYVTRTDGVTSRVPVVGAASFKAPFTGRAVVRSNPFLAPRTAGVRHRTLWAAPAGSSPIGTLTLDLTWTGSALRAPLTIRSRSPFQGSHDIAALAPGSGDDARIVAVGGDKALIAGRFLDAPSEVSARMVGLDGHRILDVPVSEIPGDAGAVTITDAGALAIAHGDRLDVWDPVRRAIPIPGSHDLAATDASSYSKSDPTRVNRSSLYLTDGAGTPQRIALGPGPQ